MKRRISKKDGQDNCQQKKDIMKNNGDDKKPHRKTKIEQHESHWKKGVNYIAPEVYAVSAPLMPPVVRVTFVKHPVIGLERGKDGNVITIDIICDTDDSVSYIDLWNTETCRVHLIR
jgi:hypothetical protein